MRILGIFRKPLMLVFLFFVFLTIIATFPLVFKLDSFIPGFSSTDEPYGALWHFWWMKYSHAEHLDSSNIKMIVAPFGQVLHSGYVYWHGINKILIIITNHIFTYNIQILASFILSGITAYILCFYLFKDSLVAIFSSIIFTFCPYHFVRTWQHLGLSFIQWMPLYILSLLLLQKNKTFRNALFSALSFSLVMAFDLYYAYFMFVVTVLFVLFDYFYYRNLKETFRLIKLISFSGFIALIIGSLDLYRTVKAILNMQKLPLAHGVYGYVRPFEDLFAQSARPLSYFLPASVHPLFGRFTEQFIGSGLYGTSLTEHTLYLGWVPLLLGLAAFRRMKKMRKQSSVLSPQSSDKEKDFHFWFFVFLAIAAWLFSQPPWWKLFGFNIYMPPFFMYRIAPMFRAYCRFGIVVMLAVAVLACFGLKFILEKFRTRKTKIVITSLFCGLVLFEFWNWPPYKVIDVSKVPAVYYWLKEQPGDFTIAEYPLDIDGANEVYKFYQTVHEKKIINGTIPGTYANKFAKTITELSKPNTAGVLKWMGVKYVLVHIQDYLNTELIEDRNELEKIPKNPGLKLVRSFLVQECPKKYIMCVQKTGPIDIYEVK